MRFLLPILVAAVAAIWAGLALTETPVHVGLVRLRPGLVRWPRWAGLAPLALTAVPIFALLFATVLPLLVLPVLDYFFCAKLKWIR
ncbi:MAG: hypothetical protein ABSC03_14220 [Verrucomicrobiota bacterium]|jgi:hypothetical protein